MLSGLSDYPAPLSTDVVALKSVFLYDGVSGHPYRVGKFNSAPEAAGVWEDDDLLVHTNVIMCGL